MTELSFDKAVISLLFSANQKNMLKNLLLFFGFIRVKLEKSYVEISIKFFMENLLPFDPDDLVETIQLVGLANSFLFMPITVSIRDYGGKNPIYDL